VRPAQQHGGGRHPKPDRTQRIALVVVGAAYAFVAAGTTAFTRSANIVTGLPIVALAVLVILRWPLRPRPLRADSDRVATSHPWRAWLILFGALVAWELAEYAARGSRADHPTLSSLTEAVVFFLWLALGVAIVRKGGRRHHHRPQPATAAGGEAP
jgi:positive regulator of sigma E activity